MFNKALPSAIWRQRRMAKFGIGSCLAKVVVRGDIWHPQGLVALKLGNYWPIALSNTMQS